MKHVNTFIFLLVFIIVFQVSITSAEINFRQNSQTVFTVDENARGEGSLSILDVTVRNGTITNLSSVFLLDQTLNFFTSPGNISMIVNGNTTDGLAAILAKGQSPVGKTSFIGDVDNFDDFDGFSRFSETNINNGTNSSAGFIGVNDIGNRISMGIASSNFMFNNLSTPNIGAIRLGSPADMLFINDFIQGWLWISDLNDSGGFQDAFTAMDLDPNGDLNVTGNLTIAEKITFSFGEIIDNIVDGWIRINGNLNVTGDAIIGGDLNVTGIIHADDVVSQGLFNRIDNATQINSDTIFNQTLPVLFAADTTNNEIEINITFRTNASFQVWDAERKFHINGVFVNVLNSDGVTIDHFVELNTRNKAFQFFFNGTVWNYGEIGKGQFVAIASGHDSITDFGNLIQENDNNSEITIIGSLEFSGVGIGSQKIISLVPTSELESDANWKGFFIDGDLLDPTGEGADIVGFEVDFSNLNTTNSPVVHGLEITVPARFDAIHVHEGQVVVNNQPTSAETSEFEAIGVRVDTVNLHSTSVWSALAVTAVGDSPGTVAAVLARNEVQPVRQEIAAFSIPSQTEFAGRKTGGGSVWADGVDGVEIFIENGDEVYLGSASQFSQIEVIMGTVADKDVQPMFYYSIGADSWTEFFPDDETSGFQSSSLVSWEPNSISGSWTNTGDPGAGDTTAGYWIKIVRVRVADVGEPNATTIKTGTVEAFGWDASGLIIINELNVSNDVFIGGNVTIGEKITFAFGEMIDNIVDGWVRVTGSLQVTENLNVTGNYSHQGQIGFTGTCINATYSGGIVVGCND